MPSVVASGAQSRPRTRILARTRARVIAPGVVAGGMVAALGFHSGGYYPVAWGWSALAFAWVAAAALVVDRRVIFLAKSEYFTGKGLKGWATRTFFQAAGQLPIDRSGGKASEASLATGLRVLGEGGILGIYPEGTRSPDAKLYRGRTGVARMVLEAGVPVIPVAMIGTEKVMPIGKRVPKVRRIGIILGEPLDFSRFEGMEGDRFVLRSVTDELVYELRALSGQEYVDVYASSVREQRAAQSG